MLRLVPVYTPCILFNVDSAGLPEASFNDKRCVSGVVCPTDPLIFTCNVTGSGVDRALINLPSGVEVALRSDNTVVVEPNLPDGITVQFHNVAVNNGVDYILSLAIERASLLNGGMIQCSDSSLTPVIDEASCPVATGKITLLLWYHMLWGQLVIIIAMIPCVRWEHVGVYSFRS